MRGQIYSIQPIRLQGKYISRILSKYNLVTNLFHTTLNTVALFKPGVIENRRTSGRMCKRFNHTLDKSQ